LIAIIRFKPDSAALRLPAYDTKIGGQRLTGLDQPAQVQATRQRRIQRRTKIGAEHLHRGPAKNDCFHEVGLESDAPSSQRLDLGSRDRLRPKAPTRSSAVVSPRRPAGVFGLRAGPQIDG
jgi:hypothetical protein